MARYVLESVKSKDGIIRISKPHILLGFCNSFPVVDADITEIKDIVQQDEVVDQYHDMLMNIIFSQMQNLDRLYINAPQQYSSEAFTPVLDANYTILHGVVDYYTIFNNRNFYYISIF